MLGADSKVGDPQRFTPAVPRRQTGKAANCKKWSCPRAEALEVPRVFSMLAILAILAFLAMRGQLAQAGV
jgi:hypothetical protein